MDGVPTKKEAAKHRKKEQQMDEESECHVDMESEHQNSDLGDPEKEENKEKRATKMKIPKGKPLVETRTLRVLYLYCGLKRRADLREWLEKLVALEPAFEAINDVHITEVDTLLDPIQSDLGDTEIQDKYLGEVRNGQFHLPIMSPPCGSWTRIVWINTLGPRPCRSRECPWGFEWAKRAAFNRAREGNAHIQFCIKVIEASEAAVQAGLYSRTLLEHPEDLGCDETRQPASIWMPEIGVRKLETTARRTRAFFQCELDDPDVTDFSSIPAKASRILTDLPGMLLVGVPGWPELDDDNHYLGPLPAKCGHDHRFTWTDRSVPGGKFYSADTAAWRSGFCHAVAAAALADFAEHVDPQTPLQKKFKFKPAENLDGAVRHQLPKNLADKLLQLLQAKIWPMTKRTAVKGRGACLGLSYGMT